MNPTTRTLAGFAFLVLPLATGCASRTAPFDDMDQAQITVMRLQGQEAPPVATPQPGAAPLIPGIPPELQAMGQQAMQGLQQILPPGILPPGLIPGQATPAPVVPAQPRFKQYVILGAPVQLTDEELRDELLDVFGDEDSFSAERGNCFYPGMGISIAGTKNPAPIDLLVSLSCNQAQMDGHRWPYPVNGFTSETHQKLSKIYEKMFGPVPPGA